MGVARHRAAASRDHEHGLLRARSRGARHPHARGRRPRLLGPAAGGRPAPLAVRPRESARRVGRLQRACLAAGRAVARRRGADRPARPAVPAQRLVDDLRAQRACGRAARSGPAQARRLRAAVRRRAARGSPEAARDARAPSRQRDRLRPPHPRAARRDTADGQRAQADEDGARVRGRGGARPAWLHRHARRARRRSAARGRGAAGGRGAQRGAADDRPPRKGPGVSGGLRGGPRQGRAGGLRRAAHLRGRQPGAAAGLDRRRHARQRRARAHQGTPEGGGRGGGEAHLLRRRHSRNGAPGAQRSDGPRDASASRRT